MSQYKIGTITTDGTNVIVGVGTSWLSEVAISQAFAIPSDNGGDAVVYTISVVTDDTHISLSVPYAGANVSGVGYGITRDFTPNLSLPELGRNDVVSEGIFTRAMRALDTILAGFSGAILGIVGGGTGSGTASGARTNLDLYSTSETIAEIENRINYRGVVDITSADSPYTITTAHDGMLIRVDASGGAVIVSAPSIATIGEPFRATVEPTDISNAITWTPDGTDTAGGAATDVLDVVGNRRTYIADESAAPDNWVIAKAGTPDKETVGADQFKTSDVVAMWNKIFGGAIAKIWTAIQTFSGGLKLGNSAVADGDVFDWYREGSWTPVYASSTGTLATVTTVRATYQRKGNRVTINLSFQIVDAGTGGGRVDISGLPFAPVAGAAGAGNDDSLGFSLWAIITTTPDVRLLKYDSTTSISTGSVYSVHAEYEV